VDFDDRPFHLDRRRTLISLAIGLALLSGAVGLIGEIASYHRMWRALSDAQHGWFALCFAGEILAYLGYIMAYRDVARVADGPVLSGWTVTRIVVIGFGAFVVGSTAGGLAVDYWALHRATGRVRDAARRVLALNTLEWAVLGTFAVVSAVAVLARETATVPRPMAVAWLVVVPVCAALGLWLARTDRVERLSRAARDDAHDDGSTWLTAHARRLLGIARYGLADALGGILIIRALFRCPWRHWAGIAGFGVYWAGDLLALYAGLRAFGIALAPSQLVLAYTTAYLITAIPLPAGGAGTTEATIAWMLNVVGVPFAPGVLAAVVYRVFAFWLPLIPAVAFLPLTGGLADDLADVRRTRLRSRASG
jgi:uncharacterized membrane protein YbhN (UPF0104 family)